MVTDLEDQISDLMRALTKETKLSSALKAELVAVKNLLKAQTPATAPQPVANGRPLPPADHSLPSANNFSSNADVETDAAPSRAPNQVCYEDGQDRSDKTDDLSGRSILYVGGRQNLLPHYRDTVQSAGAKFEHHDGGVESSMDRLSRSCSQADCVVCPVDCVSHNACLKIKNLCRKHGTEIRFLRAASVSALAQELETIEF